MEDKAFNRQLYNKLIQEDKEIIDEYIPKMMPEEVNSFMQRLIDYYAVENSKDILEVVEEIDSVLVFENPPILSSHNPNKKIILNELKIPFKIINDYFEKYFSKKHNAIQKKLRNAVFKYFEEEHAKYNYGWMPNITSASTRIRELCIDIFQNDHVVKIKQIKLPMCFYTYRDKKKRIGIALDKSVLVKTNGFGKNFILDNKLLHIITTDKLDLSAFIKNAGYWAPKNANIHDFDDRTGIIWFDGKIINDNWQFPNNFVINNNYDVYVDAVYTTDAFSKMMQRFNFNNKINNIILEFESATIR